MIDDEKMFTGSLRPKTEFLVETVSRPWFLRSPRSLVYISLTHRGSEVRECPLSDTSVLLDKNAHFYDIGHFCLADDLVQSYKRDLLSQAMPL